MFRLRLIRAICVFGFLAVSAQVRGDTQDLKRKLKEIDMQRNGLATPTAALEKECLALLSSATTQEEKGMVYFQVAMIHAQNGLTDPARTVEACRKALEFPLESRDAVLMHVHWADGLQVQHAASRGDARAELRRQIADVCLRGLKRVLDERPPEQPLPLPPVDKFDYPANPNDSTYQALVAKNKMQMAERQRVMLLNDMVMYRDILVQKIAQVYHDAGGVEREYEDMTKKIMPTGDSATAVVTRIRMQSGELKQKLAKPEPGSPKAP